MFVVFNFYWFMFWTLSFLAYVFQLNKYVSSLFSHVSLFHILQTLNFDKLQVYRGNTTRFDCVQRCCEETDWFGTSVYTAWRCYPGNSRKPQSQRLLESGTIIILSRFKPSPISLLILCNKAVTRPFLCFLLSIFTFRKITSTSYPSIMVPLVVFVFLLLGFEKFEVALSPLPLHALHFEQESRE